MYGDCSGFAAEKDKNASTKVGLFGAKKITGEVATDAANTLPTVSVATNFRLLTADYRLWTVDSGLRTIVCELSTTDYGLSTVTYSEEISFCFTKSFHISSNIETEINNFSSKALAKCPSSLIP